MQNWVKLNGDISEQGFYSKDSAKVHLWIHLLLEASHVGYTDLLDGEPVFCHPGQFITNLNQLSVKTGIPESKIEEVLKSLDETDNRITQVRKRGVRLITICDWYKYSPLI